MNTDGGVRILLVGVYEGERLIRYRQQIELMNSVGGALNDGKHCNVAGRKQRGEEKEIVRQTTLQNVRQGLFPYNFLSLPPSSGASVALVPVSIKRPLFPLGRCPSIGLCPHHICWEEKLKQVSEGFITPEA